MNVTDNVVKFADPLTIKGRREWRKQIMEMEKRRNTLRPPTHEASADLRYPTISELRPCGICGGLPIAVTKAGDLQCMACGAISQTHEVREVQPE